MELLIWTAIAVAGCLVFAGLGWHATLSHRADVRAQGYEHR